jgi:hypothetical protein
MTPALAPPAPPPQRSGAVTVIGVLFLSISAMWLLGVLFQGAFFALLASLRPAGMDLARVTDDPNVPIAIRFMATYAKLFWFANIVVAALIALCSIGLLRRKNWSRIAFIFLAAAGVVYSIGSIATSAMMAAFMRSQMKNLEALEVGPLFSTITTVAFALIIVKSLFLAGFFIWMLRKLTRPQIRAEFR